MTNLLSDIITYVRRIVKTPSNAVLTDNLIVDYINRFWLMDVDARIQTFDLKTTYQFQTQPGIDKYNMPLYSVQTQSQSQPSENIGIFPVYQGFFGPCFINGVEMPFYTQRQEFYNVWPNYNQMFLQVGTGNGTVGPYTFNLPFLQNSIVPSNSVNSGIIRGHVDLTGVIAAINSGNDGGDSDPPLDNTGQGLLIQNTTPGETNSVIPTTSIFPGVYFSTTGEDCSSVVISDTGVFLNVDVPNAQCYGLLMNPGKAPYGNEILTNGYFNTATITAITQANPCVITCNNIFTVGASVIISDVGGMTELNGNTYTILSATPTDITIDVDSSGFTAYTGGGQASVLSNVINYITGIAQNVYFPKPIPSGMPIQSQCVYYQTGIPRAVLWYNNALTFRAPPNTQYTIELGAYLTPAAFFANDNALPFGYMAEYIARGAARKILSDVGDAEQLNFYEPFFREQELLVWKRSQRQFTSTRTGTLYSQTGFPSIYNTSSFGV